MYNQLTAQIAQKGLQKPSLCLLGDSHGGLVALEMYRLHKGDLDIKGIITNHSPLEGAPGLHASPGDIKGFKDALQAILTKSGKPTLGLGALLLNNIDFASILIDGVSPIVIGDLTRDSQLLRNIQLTLSSIEIPVLLLAGNVNIKMGIVELLQFALGGLDFSPMVSIATLINEFKNVLDELVPEDPLLIDLEKTFGTVIGDKKNDCFVPFYSQAAKHIPTSPKVTAVVSKSYHHFHGIAKHQGIYSRIITFIKSAFEVKE
jgi:hypothetical protein